MHKIDRLADNQKFVVVISADIEWRAIKGLLPGHKINISPYGEFFVIDVLVAEVSQPIIFFHGGWGKISAAASTQYVIDRWTPDLLINLGTCGGFEGKVEKGTIILADKTIVYDIFDQMDDPEDALAHYSTTLDLSWLPDEYPQNVQKTMLISGDRDLVPEELPALEDKFGAVAGDWESGAIAYVAKRNETKCLILRGVSDLVSTERGEAYEDLDMFVRGTRDVLEKLVSGLPNWLALL